MIKRRKQFTNSILTVLSIIAVFTGIQVFAEINKPVSPRPIQTTLPSDTLRTRLSFAVDSLCVVVDPSHSLDTFFTQLEMLMAGKDTVIHIVHLGDSHVQAGHYSGSVMRLMQQQFGNAGRGWIAPLKLSKTNEPDDYYISSNVKDWIAGRCIQSSLKCPVGPGGIGILTNASSIDFDISVTPNNGAGYEFNRFILYRGEHSMPMFPVDKLRNSIKVLPGYTPCAPGIVVDTFYMADISDRIQLESVCVRPDIDSLSPPATFTNLYYGLSLLNGNPGILYHSIGVNGAMFVNYTDENYIAQLALLEPSLLIVSLGTNETFGRNFTMKNFICEIETFISLARKYMPHTALLLTTPPECYKPVRVNKKRTYVRNPNTETAEQAIINVANEYNIAYWDLFQATGGKNSCKNWFNGQWMGKDRVHFKKEGYREQGVLLFKALMNLKAQRENISLVNNE